MNKKLGIVLILVLLVGAIFLSGCQERAAGKRIIVRQNTSDIREEGVQFSLSVRANPPGGGRTSVDPFANGYNYYANTEVKIRATPSRGYRFSQWTGDVQNVDVNNPTITVRMNRDRSIIANFVR